MSPRRSSFRADAPGATASRWPWLLAGGPAVVVVASLATAWIAATRGDPVVDENYYKVGLTINRRLPAVPTPIDDASATLTIARNGHVRLHVDEGSRLPTHLTLSLRHPGEQGGSLALAADGPRNFAGRLTDVAPGRRIVAVESDAWRMPVTVIDGLPATIRLGKPASEAWPPRAEATR